MTEKSIAAYSTFGELDKFDGPGSEITIKPFAAPERLVDLITTNTPFAGFNELYQKFTTKIEEVTYEKRILADITKFFPNESFNNEVLGFKKKHENNWPTFDWDWYITYEFKYDKTAIKLIFDLIREVIKTPDENLKYRSLSDLILLVENIPDILIDPKLDLPAPYKNILAAIFNPEHLIYVDSYFEVYATVSTGDKFRIEGSAKASVSMRKDITGVMKDILRRVTTPPRKKYEVLTNSLANLIKYLDPKSDRWGGFVWSKWIPLNSTYDLYGPIIHPHKNITPGIYRIRSKKNMDYAYIGQSGNLRSRLVGELRNCLYKYRRKNHWEDNWKTPYDQDKFPWMQEDWTNPPTHKDFPWIDPPKIAPHTKAAPLWAYHLEEKIDFEVSVATVHDQKNQKLNIVYFRKGVEDYLIYLLRMRPEYKSSYTYVNFGKTHKWWSKAVTEKRKEVERPFRLPDSRKFPPIPVAKSKNHEEGNLLGRKWLGLDWSEFESLKNPINSSARGVYRIGRYIGGSLIDIAYFGQGNLDDRRKKHLNSGKFHNCKISYFKMTIDLKKNHQMLERESDLIGAYFKIQHKPPVMQYYGNIDDS